MSTWKIIEGQIELKDIREEILREVRVRRRRKDGETGQGNGNLTQDLGDIWNNKVEIKSEKKTLPAWSKFMPIVTL